MVRLVTPSFEIEDFDAQAYMDLLAAGAKPQMARSVLPQSTKVEIVITMTLRAWRHFFELRTAKAAHPQMRELAIPMLKEFVKRLPLIFSGINCLERA